MVAKLPAFHGPMETTAQKLRATAKPVGPELEALPAAQSQNSACGKEETKGTASSLQMTAKGDVFGAGWPLCEWGLEFLGRYSNSGTTRGATVQGSCLKVLLGDGAWEMSGDGPVLYTRPKAVDDGQGSQEWFLHTVILCRCHCRRRHKSMKLSSAGIPWT